MVLKLLLILFSRKTALLSYSGARKERLLTNIYLLSTIRNYYNIGTSCQTKSWKKERPFVKDAPLSLLLESKLQPAVLRGERLGARCLSRREHEHTRVFRVIHEVLNRVKARFGAGIVF